MLIRQAMSSGRLYGRQHDLDAFVKIVNATSEEMTILRARELEQLRQV